MAIDLGVGQPMEYALRSCVLAVRLGEVLGLGEDDLTDAYYLALLRYVGCTTEADEVAAIFGDELAARSWMGPLYYGGTPGIMQAMVRRVGKGSPPLQRARQVVTAFAGVQRFMNITSAHCEVARQIAGRLGFRPAFQEALGHTYEQWDGHGTPDRVKGEAIALPMRVVHVAQDAEAFHRMGGVEAAVAMARKRSGKGYDPRVVEAFCAVAPKIFAGLEGETAWEAVLAAEPGPRPRLSEKQLDESLLAMADFADLKLACTVGHSRGVADLAAVAARASHMADAEVRAVWRAGLVHDVGRVGVSASIWSKPGPLTDGEWERLRLHPYLTDRILARPRALAQLGALASLHHERLDGSGYHRGVPGSILPMAARVLAAADTYQTKTEPRPHRSALSPAAAAGVVQAEVRAGRLDADAANAVLAAAGHQVRPVRREWPSGLSDREVEVLRLVAHGLSMRQIAASLTISEKTVDAHIQHIYDKIGVSTRAAATLFAMQHGLLREGGQAA